MNVGIVALEYPTISNLGGVATFNFHLAKLLTSMGNRVYVFAYDERFYDHLPRPIETSRGGRLGVVRVVRDFENSALNFLYFRFPGVIFRKLGERFFSGILFSFEWNLFYWLAMKRFEKVVRLDLIHVTFYSAWFLGFIRKRPLVFHDQGPGKLLNVFEKWAWESRFMERVEDWFVNSLPDSIVGCSENVKEFLRDRYPKARARIVHIPNFLSGSCFRGKTPSGRVDVNHMFFFGRLENRKGPDLLAKAFVRLAEEFAGLRLTFIGEDTPSWPDERGRRRLYFKDWLMHLPGIGKFRWRVRFIDRIDDKTKFLQLLRRHRGVGVLPSRYEPFGFAYIEAMAAGSVVLGSEVGGGGEVIRDGWSGMVITPSVEGVVGGYRRLRKMAAGRVEKMTKNAAREVEKRFSDRGVRRRYQDLYRRLLC